MKIIPRLLLIAFIAMAIGLTGCSVLKPKADLTQYYVLRVTSQQVGEMARKESALPEIRVGPGRIADYLDNTKIATQGEANHLDYLDLHRWAEPLSKGLSRMLSENLAIRMNVKQLTVYPDPPMDASGYEVRYTVNRFEGQVAGPVTLEVSWQIVERPSSKRIAGQHSVYVIEAEPQHKDVAAYVWRLSEAVSKWANDIAVAIPSN